MAERDAVPRGHHRDPSARTEDAPLTIGISDSLVPGTDPGASEWKKSQRGPLRCGLRQAPYRAHGKNSVNGDGAASTDVAVPSAWTNRASGAAAGTGLARTARHYRASDEGGLATPRGRWSRKYVSSFVGPVARDRTAERCGPEWEVAPH